MVIGVRTRALSTLGVGVLSKLAGGYSMVTYWYFGLIYSVVMLDEFVAIFSLSETKIWIFILQGWICQRSTHFETKMNIYPNWILLILSHKQKTWTHIT